MTTGWKVFFSKIINAMHTIFSMYYIAYTQHSPIHMRSEKSKPKCIGKASECIEQKRIVWYIWYDCRLGWKYNERQYIIHSSQILKTYMCRIFVYIQKHKKYTWCLFRHLIPSSFTFFVIYTQIKVLMCDVSQFSLLLFFFLLLLFFFRKLESKQNRNINVYMMG